MLIAIEICYIFTFFLQVYTLLVSLKLNTMQLETPGGNHHFLMVKQMMYRIKDWFIYLLILSTVYEHDKQKQLYTNQTSSRWKKVNKM